MSRIVLVLAAIVVLFVIGGAIYLSTVDVPVSRQRVEKVLPSDQPPS